MAKGKDFGPPPLNLVVRAELIEFGDEDLL